MVSNICAVNKKDTWIGYSYQSRFLLLSLNMFYSLLLSFSHWLETFIFLLEWLLEEAVHYENCLWGSSVLLKSQIRSVYDLWNMDFLPRDFCSKSVNLFDKMFISLFLLFFFRKRHWDMLKQLIFCKFGFIVKKVVVSFGLFVIET